LSAAFYLEQQRRKDAPLEYVLFEKTSRLGGSLQTERADGCLIEAGPDSFLTEKPWAAELCRELGIAGQLIGSNNAERKTYILVKGRLVPIPDGLMFMVPTKILPVVFSRLFSLRAKLGMARQWFHPPRPANGDESVAALVERHYGPEMVDRLADPLLSGVYGGEASGLSVRAVLPRFAEMEAKHGSLGRGMLAARKRVANNKASPRPLFTSLKDGMQQLVDAMVARLPAEALRTGSAVRELRCEMPRAGAPAPENVLWSVTAENNAAEKFDAVILATPAPAAGALLASAQPELARELSGIAYSSSVTLTLSYERRGLRLPPGFGFLVPRSEGKRMLACTFVHNKFPNRAPRDRALIRCFLGGSRDEEILGWPDQQIELAVRQELRDILWLTAKPLFCRIYKWQGAMAQYGVGHLERLERIERLRQQLPGLALAGNGYRGIGVPDCIRSGKEAASFAANPQAEVTSVTPAKDPLAQQPAR
ncbi:MAG TPA: protoporphyrinogen oxidase, partial [Terriglobales bacterium]|nr:protoporphyrinogen oxidase [Terriglobales bacterium]